MTEEAKAPQLDLGKMTALRKQRLRRCLRPDRSHAFCCGLSSPLLTQTKLNKHPDFGSLAEVPFQIVMKAAEQVAQPTTDQQAGGRRR